MLSLLSKICKILNDYNVQYLIIGGTAVSYHGYSRSTILPNGKISDKYDFDIWYRPTLSNYINITKSLKKFNIEIGNDFSKFYFFQKEFNEYELDFLPYLEFITEKDNKKIFIDFYNKRDISRHNNVDIHFINKKNLIYIKKLSNRPKDIIDIEHLNNI